MPHQKEWVCECEWESACGNCKNECECHCIDDLSNEELMRIMIKKGNMLMSDMCGKHIEDMLGQAYDATS